VPDFVPAIRELLRAHGVGAYDLGHTGGERLQASYGEHVALDLAVGELAAAWLAAVPEAMA
jgi:hypothetical protein